MPAIRPDSQAREMLLNYYWPGNVRQLKNITEQISVIEQEREVTAVMLTHYLPDFQNARLPVPVKHKDDQGFGSEREILYKILFDMKSDMHDLKNLVYEMISSGGEVGNLTESGVKAVRNLFSDSPVRKEAVEQVRPVTISFGTPREKMGIQDTEEVVEESLSLTDREKELIKKALEKNNGKRKLAAAELGISERTLYRKIKEYDLEG